MSKQRNLVGKSFRVDLQLNYWLQTLSWLHRGNETEALREAVRHYWDQEGNRAEEIKRLAEENQGDADTWTRQS